MRLRSDRDARGIILGGPGKYDIDRVVRSVLSWEASEQAVRELDADALMKALTQCETAKAEDTMRHAVVIAQQAFDKMYA